MSITTATQSADGFLDYLHDVLRRDSKVVKDGRKNYRALADALSPILRSGAQSVRERRSAYDRDVWRETARGQAEQADALARHARRMLKLLHRVYPVMREAVANGFLPHETPAQPPALSELSDFMKWGNNGWATAIRIRRPLERLAQEADEWASKATREGRRPRGPQRSKARDRLSVWVAIQLAQAGVLPTTAKRGTFARVLAGVHVVAGFPERSLERMERDVRRALQHPSFIEAVASETKDTTHFASKKIRNS